MAGQLLPIAALLASTFLMLLAGGLAGILLPLRGGMEGWSTTTIGWMGTSYSLAFTIGCIFIPHLVRRVGHVRVFSALLTLLSMALLFHALVVNPAAWMIFRGIAGFSLAGSYMIIESWLNERVTNESRGMIFSIYMIITMVGLLLGQYILPFGNAATQTLFIICAIIYASALLPTALSSAQSPNPLTQVSLDLKGLYRRSPAAVVGSFIAGIVAGTWNFLAAIYGEMNGLSTFGIATMLASAMIGGAIFQYPLGRASDFVDRRYMMILAGAIGFTLSFIMVLFHPTSPYTLYAMMFLFGSVVFPIYSLNVAHANDYADASEFVKISGGLLIVYGVGSVLGPAISGPLMDAIGANGFFVTMAIAYCTYGLHAWWRIYRLERPAISDQKTEFKFHTPDGQSTPETMQLDPRAEGTSGQAQ
ncbi:MULTISPECIES: MFS transporter [unclassified Brucella]|uniref:MFS transporter n=1 Tax=unclassified Brucella TaxID=2632610 RepID=UPI0009727A24|nr:MULTISPECIES: MFS transporter [unclassified Brucella]APX69302.1 MFS transporter [Brucella sp. 09RB8471]MRN77164.1 MFS transporter [Brucella sp. 10RB9210]QGA57567.1 MFS transporter [Brucella sp. 2280]